MKKIYKLGTVSMFNFLNSPLQELPGPSPSTVLIIIFVLKIYCAWFLMSPHNYTVVYQ